MIEPAVEAAIQEIAGPPPSDLADGLRGPPPPLHGGPLTLLRFMRRHRMLTFKYARLIVRMFRRKLFLGKRLKLAGSKTVGDGITILTYERDRDSG